MQRHCPHRGADLAYGRLEPDGLRCSFHGWLFDAAGKCLETPAEPEGSRLCEHIRQTSPIRWSRRAASCSPTSAQASRRPFPHFDCFVAPDAYTFAFKGYWDCNWLQALEVGIDPAHASWLHKFFEDEDPAESYGKQFRGTPADSEMPISKVLREYDRPEIRVERTDYGMRLQTLRRISDAQTHIRVTNILFPQAFVIPMNAEMTITQLHVPVDDTGCYWYSIFTSFGAPVDKDTMRAQRLKTYPAPDYKPIHGRDNGWGFDADEQQAKTFTGMGFDINIHDQFACESQGRDPRPHQGEPRHHRQGHRALPPAAGGRDPEERGGREAADGAGCAERARAHRPAGGRRHRPHRPLEEYWKESDANAAQADRPGRSDEVCTNGHLKAVRFSFADQHGVLRGKTLAAAEAEAALERGVDGHQHAAAQGHLAQDGVSRRSRRAAASACPRCRARPTC